MEYDWKKSYDYWKEGDYVTPASSALPMYGRVGMVFCLSGDKSVCGVCFAPISVDSGKQFRFYTQGQLRRGYHSISTRINEKVTEMKKRKATEMRNRKMFEL